ncbi:MAG TPA: hypothetical protein DD670_06325, partial [Planctomycetaceae bacterium]|nr:hypothetical protein [Planctomycetaceae bacterium]
MFGLETEYALSALGSFWETVEPTWLAPRFMEVARRSLPHLSSGLGPGIFLENGSRFYIDTGAHPELATPELVNPWDACRYVLAGDEILAGVADRLVQTQPGIAEIVLTRGNVCHGPAMPTSWGCHESYGHEADPETMASELMPHLVSRLIYTGAGGFNNLSAGIEFMLSPRVAHLEQVMSEGSTHARGICHCKHESLSRRGFSRLHILCGESNCSHTAMWLKTAVTAIVVAMIEAGLEPCRAIRLCRPLVAMRRFAGDVEGKSRACSLSGRWWTALGMQRHILHQIETHVDHPIMPSWAPEACDSLRVVLDRIEEGPAGVAKSLDWGIKLALYREFARRRGIRWASIPAWSKVIVRLDRALKQVNGATRPQRLDARVLCSGGPIADEVQQLTPFLDQNDIKWSQFDEVLGFREELLALETRFSQLSDRGIFNTMDSAGALEHQVPGVDRIADAVAHPPPVGRARLRGECVRQFHDKKSEYYCDWSCVWDFRHHRYLDLSEPFATEEKWREL